ncbi:hypothetical protein PR048_018998 [Dryococelus australis]|uniref:Uncharacterized protein n=1 Tax=Dryococelus australis TaxID=614101 RepID=A0ABQ9H2C1_9NEOP|nr:hypothetical protein PR048_018998 [Dryococelus australis]
MKKRTWGGGGGKQKHLELRESASQSHFFLRELSERAEAIEAPAVRVSRRHGDRWPASDGAPLWWQTAQLAAVGGRERRREPRAGAQSCGDRRRVRNRDTREREREFRARVCLCSCVCACVCARACAFASAHRPARNFTPSPFVERECRPEPAHGVLPLRPGRSLFPFRRSPSCAGQTGGSRPPSSGTRIARDEVLGCPCARATVASARDCAVKKEDVVAQFEFVSVQSDAPSKMDILPSGNIFRELQDIHDTGYFSAQPSLEDHWQQVR